MIDSKMKIVINALSARRGGGQTYLLNLLKNIDSYSGKKIYVLAPDSLDSVHPGLQLFGINKKSALTNT